ncbi:outer membrane lipoprotein carrier protein LolA [Brucepastera parasyntrophica]|uniref:LolA family protein n=1 Tax=Brucepastera parasyntrophica TaxID=2880008 RepID=UPI002108A0D6|nr:outer membrane lipoprotein carrier protein LolA [Brucepastera parasyntrophica]ULQ60741.1 outer membrane lipoprotein carrier protein LolA [Brucepastera parasyntrophica]
MPCMLLSAQTSITTADTFFSSVSDVYASIRDYSANITITSGTGSRAETMTGRVIFKVPHLLRIDFTRPDEQAIVFNGDMLTIYLPSYNVVLNQSVEKSSSASGASLATPQGLALMKRFYSVAYEEGPDPVPIRENARETVIVLLLSRRSATEMFRTIRLKISPESKLIRVIEAQTVTGDQITFEFSDYSLNQGILDNRFIYDAPPSANAFNNFLFSE